MEKKKIKIKKSKVWKRVFIFLLAVGVIFGAVFNYLVKKEKTLTALDNCLSRLKTSQSPSNHPDVQLIRLKMDNSSLKNLQFILKTERQNPLLKNLILKKYKLLISQIEKEKNRLSFLSLVVKREKKFIEKPVDSAIINLYLRKGGGTSWTAFLNQQKFFYLKRLGELDSLTERPCGESEKAIRALSRKVRRTPEEKSFLTRMRLPKVLKVYTQEVKRKILLNETEIILTSLINKNVK